ncbi:MAG TPA: hypothetical protein VMV29_01090 [Ktedonobacterales bacterium]|nr:hypothetical protein [Ktedonobacterales bacterium]
MTQTLRSYTALIYPMAQPNANRVSFRAECVQYPGIVAERDTPQSATEAIRQGLMVAIAAGEPETPESQRQRATW